MERSKSYVLLFIFLYFFILFLVSGTVIASAPHISTTLNLKINYFFTILINSFEKRLSILLDSLDFWNQQRMMHLYEIVVNYNSDSQTLLTKMPKNLTNVRIFFNNETTMSGRFRAPIFTNAIFNVDDDIRISGDVIEKSFKVWEKNEDCIVGFIPRNYVKKKNGDLKYSYLVKNYFSIILIGASFFHKKYISIYYSPENEINLKIVRTLNNCDDLLMNFVISNFTHHENIWISAKFSHISKSGQSTLKAHDEKRHKCMNQFFWNFGYMPLILSKNKIIL
ncbi:glycosyltransferase family 64 protein EPC1 [Tritrichomonas foetus]|uniref:Glycosyltransferase family 64 protein EPC1 n=1 Tax=Tritrichomonas foetus TaxID=1144522 RepID=A0A1J4KUH4_9EUKA|nr:glycosyltransferase family 64 protein EPC1 [Tritrichomonas foetus]|eukprot:OHT14929.1 glycosyltransferase family 64 protein EPC1 [Tritrichomonas foetus]